MFLIFDIGGTRMRLAISSEGKNISKKEIVDTPKNFEEGMTKFKEVLAKLTGGESIEKSVGGIRRLNPTFQTSGLVRQTFETATFRDY